MGVHHRVDDRGSVRIERHRVVLAGGDDQVIARFAEHRHRGVVEPENLADHPLESAPRDGVAHPPTDREPEPVMRQIVGPEVQRDRASGFADLVRKHRVKLAGFTQPVTPAEHELTGRSFHHKH